MHRFYCSRQNIAGDKIIITDTAQVHHIKDVLRMKKEDKVVVFDEQGNEYGCVIKKISEDAILLNRDRHHFFPQKMVSVPKLTIACAIPKKSKMDDIVDKFTQLGVDTIIPLLTERVTVKLDKNKADLRLKRWQRVALSAAKQCQSNKIPVIAPVTQIKDLLKNAKDSDLKLIPTLSGDRETLKEILNRDRHNFFPQKMVSVPNIFVLIGPEGDFSPAEIDLAKKAGFIPVSLGDLVLRVETAAVATVSFIKLNAQR